MNDPHDGIESTAKAGVITVQLGANVGLEEITFRPTRMQALCNPPVALLYRFAGLLGLLFLMSVAKSAWMEGIYWCAVLVVALVFGPFVVGIVQLLRAGPRMYCLAIDSGRVGVGFGLVEPGIEAWIPVQRVRLGRGLMGASLLTVPSDDVLIIPPDVITHDNLARLLHGKEPTSEASPNAAPNPPPGA
jgi:hypothetical protein